MVSCFGWLRLQIFRSEFYEYRYKIRCLVVPHGVLPFYITNHVSAYVLVSSPTTVCEVFVFPSHGVEPLDYRGWLLPECPACHKSARVLRRLVLFRLNTSDFSHSFEGVISCQRPSVLRRPSNYVRISL